MNENDNNSKIVKMEDAKGKKPAKNQPKAESAGNDEIKYSKEMIDEDLFDYFDQSTPLPLLKYIEVPDFGLWFFNADEISATRAVKIENGIAQEIDERYIYKLIKYDLRQFREPGAPHCCYVIGHQRMKQLANSLMLAGRRLKEWPAPISFASDKSPSFQKFNFDPLVKPPFKFDFIKKALNRITNADALCMRIGSFYDPNASRKQAFWLFGPSGGGKTAILKLLECLVGTKAAHWFRDGLQHSAFGMEPLLDKRAWLGEEIDPKFLESPFFKVVTGGGQVGINPKGKKMYNAELHGFMFLSSNHAPEIKSDDALQSRLVVCECEPIPDNQKLKENEVVERFNKELPAFIGYCKDLYERNGKPTIIPSDQSALSSAMDDHEYRYGLIFDKYYVEDLTKLNQFAVVPMKRFHELFDEYIEKNPNTSRKLNIRDFKRHVERRTNQSNLKWQKKLGGKNTICVRGIRFKKG